MRRFQLLIMILTILLVFNHSFLLGQTEWIKDYDVSPFLTMGEDGEWDDRYLTESSLIYDEVVGEYKLWYSAKQWGETGYRIGLATSTDMEHWEKHENNPVMYPSPAGNSDDWVVMDPSVIYEDSIYKMWYSGKNSSNVWSCNYAESEDGIEWVRPEGVNPVLEDGDAGEWDNGFVGYNTVVRVDGTYFMYYSGAATMDANNEIGLATSSDGINFNKFANNPVISPGDAWDVAIFPEAVIYDGDRFHLWYGGEGGGSPFATGYAWSLDGFRWTKHELPVLENGDPETWDDLGAWPGSVILEDSTFHMIYESGAFDTGVEFGLAHSIIPPVVGTVNQNSIPQNFRLNQNYPNPFNPSTTIGYIIPELADVNLTIYDITGQEIYSVNSPHHPVGYHDIKWNGMDKDGLSVRTGVYFARLTAGSFSQTIKMVYMK